ncbi:MAG: FAD-binding protein, partial [Syntrophaceticus sp.]|nr:FAD-binding protein [Syntrophaceticus sp.]
ANPGADAYMQADPHSARIADLTAALADTHSFRAADLMAARVAALADDAHKEQSGTPGNRRKADSPQFTTSGLRHPTSISQAGVRVNQQLLPVDEDGSVLLENVFCAGRILAGYDPFIEGSGAGVAVSTGYKAAVEAGRLGNDE